MIKKIITALLTCSCIFYGNSFVSILEPEEVEASSYNDLAQRPFMGWSSWSSIRKHPTEENMKLAADIMASKFKSHGYEYVNLDDYYMLDWSTTVDPYGRWAVDPNKFPHGMKAVGDYIHKKGLKFGLYVTLGIPKGAVELNTPIEGTPYHAKDIVDLSKKQKVNFNFKNMYSIDFSKPGAQSFIDSWAKLFASYGVDYLKIDGVRGEDIPDVEAWAKALNKTGRPIHVELSNNLDIKNVSIWKQLSNGWRTDHDVESYGKPTLTDWAHVSRRFSHAAKWQSHAEAGGWNDFDSLNVANGSKDGLTKDEKRSYVSLWAIAASHFVIGNDLTKLDSYGLSLLTNDEIISANQSGVAGKRLHNTSNYQVFYQKLPDGSFNVGLFNTGTSKESITVNWGDLGVNGSANVHDMWSHKDLGSKETGFTASLSSHASRMIHVVPSSSLTVSPKNGAIGVDSKQVTLNWKSQSGADCYQIQVATDPDFNKIITNKIIPSSELRVNKLKKNTRHYWKVTALSDKTKKLIGVYTFYTKMTTAPAAPDWIIADRKNNQTVSLTWNPTHGAESYNVYRKKINSIGLSSGYTLIKEKVKDPNYLDDTAKQNDSGSYSYLVTADNAIGESEKLSEVTIDEPSTVYKTLPWVSFFTLVFSLTFIRINRDKSTKEIVYDLSLGGAQK